MICSTMLPRFKSKQHLAYGTIILLLMLYIVRDKMNPVECVQKERISTDTVAGNITHNKVVDVTKATSVHSCPTCHVFDLNAQNTFRYKCVDLKSDPVTPICIYPDAEDVWVSKSLRLSGQWEGDLVGRMQSWLLDNKECGVIDIGCNLGVYSLAAAAMGRYVVSVEPNLQNIRHFHLSVQKGELAKRITLLQNALSDDRSSARIIYSDTNQGDTRIQPAITARSFDEESFAKMILMDDLLPFCAFRQAIMKIDIQGFEHRAFVHAQKLFDAVDILHVMMEWETMIVIYNDRSQRPQDAELVENMLEFFYTRNYIPRTSTGELLRRENWPNWPQDITWHKYDRANGNIPSRTKSTKAPS